jgi:folate-binding protein YgfZ
MKTLHLKSDSKRILLKTLRKTDVEGIEHMTIQEELDAILHRCAIAPLSARGNSEIARAFLRVTGSDATRWLNGMVTNSVQALAPGEGCYNFLLNAQGRILADCTIYREPDSAEPPSFLLETGNWQLETVRQHLDHFIIMDDVELTPVLSEHQGLLLAGPGSQTLVDTFYVGAGAPLRMFEFPSVGGATTILLSQWFGLVPRFELFDLGSFEFPQATEVSAEALEALRLLEGRPLYGRDITEKYLPQETNQQNALHFSKGCYLGQEIVERIRSRGQVHRLLTPLTLTGEFPNELPTPIEADGKPVGEITSAAVVPLPDGDHILALGYVRREALDTHQSLSYSGGTATPRSLPKSSASNPTESIHA